MSKIFSNIFEERIYPMKKTLCISALCIIMSLNAGATISPAIDIISDNLNIYKCSVSGTDVTFSAKDFEEIYPDMEYLTISKLPDIESGVLKIGGLDAVRNQTISVANISNMKFVPSSSGEINATFSVSDAFNSDSVVNCNIFMTSSLNVSPKAKSSSFKVTKNSKLYKRMLASDTENDKLSFSVKAYPKHGKLTVSDTNAGTFVYTPEHNYVGKDKFTFICTDAYGNKSEKATVTIEVINNEKSVFSDISGHWCEVSAQRMYEIGIMQGENDMFMPEQEISRGDFLAMATIATGNEKNISVCYKSAFSDDSQIPLNIKSYAEYALASGIISGYEDEGATLFLSQKPITRAEACVILYNYLDLPESQTTVPDAPAWAQKQMAALYECGIINGDDSGLMQSDRIMSKAEAAEILCNAMDYIEDIKKKQEKKTIFNLFGLLKN